MNSYALPLQGSVYGTLTWNVENSSLYAKAVYCGLVAERQGDEWTVVYDPRQDKSLLPGVRDTVTQDPTERRSRLRACRWRAPAGQAPCTSAADAVVRAWIADCDRDHEDEARLGAWVVEVVMA